MPRRPNPHPYHKTITRYLDSNGRQVPKSAPGAAKHTIKTATYYADIPGIGTVSLKTENEALAWKRLNDRLREQHQRELGVSDEFSDYAKMPILTHLDDWIEVLEAKGTSEKQRRMVRWRLTALFAETGWTRAGQINADSAQLALAKRGQSAQTRNHYITHLRGFCAWMVSSGRLARSPVASLEKANVDADRRHLRRPLSREEVAELFRYLEGPDAAVRRGMSGRQRAIGYRVAMATGYRAREWQTLTRESFNLDAKTVSLAAAEDKRRKPDLHPLPGWLVDELKEWFAAGGGCWEGFPAYRPGAVLKDDLYDAREAWIAAAADEVERQKRSDSTFLCYRVETENGPAFADTHSLRVFYITELASQPGMDLKTLMTLARHSTPQLSLNVYARARSENLRAATDLLKPLSLPPDSPNPKS